MIGVQAQEFRRKTKESPFPIHQRFDQGEENDFLNGAKPKEIEQRNGKMEELTIKPPQRQLQKGQGRK